MKQIKTNAMRLLEEKKIDYVAYEYESKGFCPERKLHIN